MRDLFVVSCTAGAKEETLLFRSLQKLGFTDYFFFEHNRRGLPDCYNDFLDRLAGTDKILVLVHSDVTIADVFFQEKLSEAAKAFNIVGLIGSARFDIFVQSPHYAWTIWPLDWVSGAVEQVLENGQSLWNTFGPTPQQCVVLDGLFLAIDMLVIGNIRFDTRFTLHMYDLDFCLTAQRAQLVLGTTNVYVHHASIGNFTTDAYQWAVQEFRLKWTLLLSPKP